MMTLGKLPILVRSNSVGRPYVSDEGRQVTSGHPGSSTNTNSDYNLRFRHFDRRATKWPEVECLVSARHEVCLHPERSRRARLRFAALEMTQTSAFIK